MNIPNILTTIRFFLVPLFVYVFFSSIENNVLIATYIFLLAGVTDVLDGYIARKYDLITKYGTVLDPLADKLMLVTVLLCFTIKRYIPIWIIMVVGLKEIVMIIGGIFLYYRLHEAVIPADKYGKMTTVSFYFAVVSIAFGINRIVMYSLIIFSLTLAILAFANYLNKFTEISESMNKRIDK